MVDLQSVAELGVQLEGTKAPLPRDNEWHIMKSSPGTGRNLFTSQNGAVEATCVATGAGEVRTLLLVDDQPRGDQEDSKRRKGLPALRIRFQINNNGELNKNQPFIVEFEGVTREGLGTNYQTDLSVTTEPSNSVRRNIAMGDTYRKSTLTTLLSLGEQAAAAAEIATARWTPEQKQELVVYGSPIQADLSAVVQVAKAELGL